MLIIDFWDNVFDLSFVWFYKYSSTQTILQKEKCCLMMFSVEWKNSVSAHGKDPLAS